MYLMKGVDSEMRNTAMSGWYFLNFGSKEDGHLGDAIVQAHDLVSASREAWRLGCNPGGNMWGEPLENWQLPEMKYRERLLTKAETFAAFGIPGSRVLN